jgi:hypothetical protein
MSISKRLLRTVEKIGITQRQNLEWLIEFAESEADTPTMRDECLLFISRVTCGGVSPSTELPLQSLRSTIRRALVASAGGKIVEIVIDIVSPPKDDDLARAARVTVILHGEHKNYDIPGRNGSALFLFAASDLLRELRSEISLCAYENCHRGSLGLRRLFLRNRRARYCCRTCANNAASDAFLAKPENRERRLARRKLRFIFTCPNCKTESPVEKMLIDVECPNCGKHYLSGSRNSRPKGKHDKGA